MAHYKLNCMPNFWESIFRRRRYSRERTISIRSNPLRGNQRPSFAVSPSVHKRQDSIETPPSVEELNELRRKLIKRSEEETARKTAEDAKRKLESDQLTAEEKRKIDEALNIISQKLEVFYTQMPSKLRWLAANSFTERTISCGEFRYVTTKERRDAAVQGEERRYHGLEAGYPTIEEIKETPIFKKIEQLCDQNGYILETSLSNWSTGSGKGSGMPGMGGGGGGSCPAAMVYISFPVKP